MFPAVSFHAVAFDTAAGRSLLGSLTLEVRPGEVTAILGHSGAGKSTLCKLLAGELALTRGVIRRDGRPVVHCDQAWSRSSGELGVDPAWSIGEYRIALLESRTSAVRPGLVVLDEPTRNLDPRSAERLGAMVCELAAQGAAVVFSSHDREWTRAIADEAFVVDEGHVVPAIPRDVDFLAIQERTLAILRSA